MIISRTPFRMSFFGGGTDYPVWYREHGGAVLLTTLDKYCYITCRHLPPFFAHLTRIAYSRVETVSSNCQIKHPAVRAVLEHMNISDGVEIHHDGDLPARSGLGSSSAFTVGLLHALSALQEKIPSKMDLARDAIFIEQSMLRECVGCQDQVAAAYGGLLHVNFHPNDAIQVNPVVVSSNRLNQLQDHLLLFFTGFSRIASKIAQVQVMRIKEKQCELNAMRQMVDEAMAILRGNDDIGNFGKLLNESWRIKRSLTNKITNAKIDALYEAVLRAGAIGGKILGAGGGGFMLVFARPEYHDGIIDTVKGLVRVPVRFEDGGTQIIFNQPNKKQSFEGKQTVPMRKLEMSMDVRAESI